MAESTTVRSEKKLTFQLHYNIQRALTLTKIVNFCDFTWGVSWPFDMQEGFGNFFINGTQVSV